MLCIPWGGECLFGNQVTSGHQPHGEMWWVMRCWAQEILVLPHQTLLALQRHGWGQGELGEASWCLCGFVLLSVMATARPQLPHHCISTLVAGISCSTLLPPQLSRLQILGITASSGALCEPGEGQAPWLCFSAWHWQPPDNRSHTSVLHLPVLPQPLHPHPVSGLTQAHIDHSRQDCSLYLSAPQGFVPSLKTHSELWAVSVTPISVPLPSPPQFILICPPSDVSMSTAQPCWCVEQRILSWVIAVQFVATSRGRDQGNSCCLLLIAQSYSFWVFSLFYMSKRTFFFLSD